MRNAFNDLRFVIRQLLKAPGFTLTAALTLAFGIGAALAAIFATHLLRSMLFEVGPLYPSVIVLAAFSLLALALAASLIPARRAASVEPLLALRGE